MTTMKTVEYLGQKFNCLVSATFFLQRFHSVGWKKEQYPDCKHLCFECSYNKCKSPKQCSDKNHQ